MPLDRSFDPNVWSAAHQIPIGRDENDNIVPIDTRTGKRLANAPGWGGAAASPSSSPPPAASGAGASDPRAQTVQFWVSKGAPSHVAEGIADRVQAESGFRPTIPGDSGTSVGLYQHHADRKAALMQQPGWQSPLVQHQFAYSEVTGGDPIATKHWQEILAAPDRATAAALWDRYFERSAGGVGGTRRMPGRLGGMGPQVPIGGAEPADGASRLRHALTPTPDAPGTPIQIAPAPPPAAAAPPPLPSVAVPQAPALHTAYRDALAAILAGKRRGLDSIFG